MSFRTSKTCLVLALGKTISGEPFVAELTKMPHLLVAGSTGSGKSVSLNTMIISILFKATPLNVTFHDDRPQDARALTLRGHPPSSPARRDQREERQNRLRWLIDEMERRYQLMSEKGVRNIEKYNQKVAKQEGGETIPYIVVVIDELGRPDDGLVAEMWRSTLPAWHRWPEPRAYT